MAWYVHTIYLEGDTECTRAICAYCTDDPTIIYGIAKELAIEIPLQELFCDGFIDDVS